MDYHSIFNMLRHDQWEVRLNELLDWALHLDASAACWLFERSEIGPVDRVVRIQTRTSGVGGSPDLVLEAERDGLIVELLVELKIGAFPTEHQQTEYSAWRDHSEADRTAYLLMAPAHRNDLRGERFVALEELLDVLEASKTTVSLSSLIEDSRNWFVDPQVDEATALAHLALPSIPYWPLREIVRTLRSRTADAGSDVLEVVTSARKTQGRSGAYYGFLVKGVGAGNLAWVGFYLHEGRAWFAVDFAAGVTPAYSTLQLRDSGYTAYPTRWTLSHDDHGPWSAGMIWTGGLDRVVATLTQWAGAERDE